MAVPLRHLFAQGPVIAALGRVALAGLLPHTARAAAPPALPGPWIERTLPPRPDALVRDYVRHVGGEPAWYRGRVPAHLFPQWGFPLAAGALAGLSYPLARAVNGGCRIEQHGALPAGEALAVRVRIEAIDDDGRRAVLTLRVVTGTRSAPDAVVADMRVFVPLATARDVRSDRAHAPRPTVAEDAREIARFALGADAGRDFAKLTGDLNPIHWLPAYARAQGFRACILHGFGTLARAVEALARARLAGDPLRLAAIDVRFTRPLVLPARVGAYVATDAGAGRIWIGDAPGGAAYLEGSYDARPATDTDTERAP
jgi:acyl dehydratase